VSVQIPSQHWLPGGQRSQIGGGIGTQTPFSHAPPFGHTTPQLPQLSLSLDVLVQPSTQHDSNGGQPVEAQPWFGGWQVPPIQNGAAAEQTLPHAPQLFGSDSMFAEQLASLPPSSTTHCPIAVSQLVPAGQSAFELHGVPIPIPSSP
jgi:hypothetical protein